MATANPANQGKNKGKGTGRVPPVANRFKPGQSGNPSGRPKGSRSITAIIRRMLNEGVNGKDVAEEIALQAIKRAKKGDFRFFREIVERIDGKVADHVQLTGIASGPIQIEPVASDVIRNSMNNLESDAEAAAAMDMLATKLIGARKPKEKPDVKRDAARPGT